MQKQGYMCPLILTYMYAAATKYFFTNRIINVWNSLPDTVVMSETVNQFKKQIR